MTDETSKKPVTDDNATEDTIGKPVTTTSDPAGPGWLQIGSITLKDEEKSIILALIGTVLLSTHSICFG